MGAGVNLQNPPEIADGGYWYLVSAVPDSVMGGQTPGEIPGIGWCAWYSGGLVAVRTPEPVSGVVTVDGSVDDVLAGAKPYGRVGGS